MLTSKNLYSPDYAISPGDVLEERLASTGLSQAEFARRCNRSAKLISEIISGKASVETETALQFEKVLGLDASIWLGIDSNYRLFLARRAEAVRAEESLNWAKAFPISEMKKRGFIPAASGNSGFVDSVLKFFGVADETAWKAKYETVNVAFRHSKKYRSDYFALTAWLRLGELDAEKQNCPAFDESCFKDSLVEVRKLTTERYEVAMKRVASLCNEAGVAFTVIRPFSKTPLSGAAWWLHQRKAIIQLSARHLTDDHLWFSFFHEAAHLLLHNKKLVFIDNGQPKDQDAEREADVWAENHLIAKAKISAFIRKGDFSESSVRSFANDEGIAAGIVVGMLQHRRMLNWNQMNHLKVRLKA